MASHLYVSGDDLVITAVDQASHPIWVKGPLSLSMGAAVATRALKRSFNYVPETAALTIAMTPAQVKAAIEAAGTWGQVGDPYVAPGEFTDRDDAGAWYAIFVTSYTSGGTDRIRG